MMRRFRSGKLWGRNQRLSAHNIDHQRRLCSRLAFHSVSKDATESLIESQRGGLSVPDGLSLTESDGSLEVAVSWVWNVDSACGACGDELDRGGLRHVVSFVSDDVYVVATVIDEGHVPGIDVGFAVGVGPVVLRDGSCGDNDEAMAGVCVPAGASSGLPDIALDIEV